MRREFQLIAKQAAVYAQVQRHCADARPLVWADSDGLSMVAQTGARLDALADTTMLCVTVPE